MTEKLPAGWRLIPPPPAEFTADQEIRRAALAAAVELHAGRLDTTDAAAVTLLKFAHSFELFIRDGYGAEWPTPTLDDINSPENVAARLIDRRAWFEQNYEDMVDNLTAAACHRTEVLRALPPQQCSKEQP